MAEATQGKHAQDFCTVKIAAAGHLSDTRACRRIMPKSSSPTLIDDVVPTRGYQMLPMVGLGGSAGRIPALQAFFRAMPADSGLAFVVILHLSPEHESTLAQMLQRRRRCRWCRSTPARRSSRIAST